eukprot:1158816-Pelagomonas_calceolata.AAC.6
MAGLQGGQLLHLPAVLQQQMVPSRDVEKAVFLSPGSKACHRMRLPPDINERKQYDEKLVKMDTKRLCELTSAADSLEMRPLVGAGSVNDVVFRR